MARPICQKSLQLWILFPAAVLNIIALIYLTSNSCNEHTGSLCSDCGNTDVAAVSYDYSTVTVVLREFEDFDNDVSETVASFSRAYTKSTVLIVVDSLPYPPLILSGMNSVHLIPMLGSVDRTLLLSRPENYIKSEYILLIPDGIRLSNQLSIRTAMEFFKNQQKINPTITMTAWPMNHTTVKCVQLSVDQKRWTVNHQVLENQNICDAVEGDKIVLLLRTKTLLDLPYPYLRPLQPAIFIQNCLRGHKVVIGRPNTLFYQNINLFDYDQHKKWKHANRELSRLREAYSLLGVKLVHYANGKDEWYGCKKDTARCFGTVVNDMPEFIYQSRWTPPCCLQALRTTVQHVFKILTDEGVRFWLEGGSLLGAVRNGDIIPWDYDVDIGIYRDDILKSQHLVACQAEDYEDDEGFVWERASEGEFFRVQYSQTNHLHVDIFPFYSVNGTMTKNTWFITHRQDREFPEAYLKPLDKIPFVGIQAPVPNNARKFLEFKFGPGVIENPKYPNSRPV